jgi:hypothetical protein
MNTTETNQGALGRDCYDRHVRVFTTVDDPQHADQPAHLRDKLRVPECEGRFLAWGVENDCDQTFGIYQFTCAIIELKDGNLKMIHPSMLQFL